MTLGHFLRSRMGAPGRWNCSTMPADWCVEIGHPDFAAGWRGLTDAIDCDNAAVGGLVPLWDRGIGDALRPVADPDAGDIAVVTVGKRERGAVFTGERWALQGGRGLHFLAPGQVTLLKAWRP